MCALIPFLFPLPPVAPRIDESLCRVDDDNCVSVEDSMATLGVLSFITVLYKYFLKVISECTMPSISMTLAGLELLLEPNTFWRVLIGVCMYLLL